MPLVNFNTKVQYVKFNEIEDNFSVRVEKLDDNTSSESIFDYIIVGSGHFSVPNVPDINGIEKFKGRILHSHDLRNFEEFLNKQVLLVSHFQICKNRVQISMFQRWVLADPVLTLPHNCTNLVVLNYL